MQFFNWILDELIWLVISLAAIFLWLHFANKRDTSDHGPSNSNSEYYSSGIDPKDR